MRSQRTARLDLSRRSVPTRRVREDCSAGRPCRGRLRTRCHFQSSRLRPRQTHERLKMRACCVPRTGCSRRCSPSFVVSGIANIVIAHPRFYWGDSGFFDTPAAFELPIATLKWTHRMGPESALPHRLDRGGECAPSTGRRAYGPATSERGCGLRATSGAGRTSAAR